ncbi:DUF6194 family protein [Marinitenerispora sediminis]|uniref:DUF6194 domain-containing protein n=1 Tax=Marinitenerispora sediminis TaxID=1931232 RepID=A0A368T9K9_9ACTN|nr:DUF6194 family protein [Marinitenerispora sediminis]RCV49016.1 hypothetical protein DEF28_22030 [Marinitenerispora sediminis]RCV51740.1 hypothetical protein DEF23_19975 [Marinitenerispora sediminis]RCV60964.1 hypothetical protein DEF24_05450 [Marinitenerispora sediminis]
MDATDLQRYIRDTFDGTTLLEANGDSFFVYDPDGGLPPERQMPFATIVTGDNYDRVSELDRDPGDYRLNIGLTKATYTARFGTPPTRRDADGVLETGADYTERDRLMPHPYYASQYWVGVVNPSPATFDAVRPLLTEAHAFAARKYANQRARRTTT